MKKLLAITLTLAMMLSLMSVANFTVSAGTGGHSQADAVAWIRNQEGSTYAGSYGYQCVDLVREYYAYLGQAKPTGNANTYLNDSNGHKPSGWTIHYGTSGIQPGDITVWTGDENGHVAIVVEVGSNSCTVMQQNADGHGDQRTEASKGHYGTQYFSRISGYIHPDFPANNNDPIGYIDVIRSENEELIIRGWAYDPDSINSPVSLHVYVGGKAGSGASGYNSDINGKTIKANLYRTDLERYWGFDARIKITERGNQDIYVYAIKNEGGNNPELGLSTGVNRQVFINQNPVGYIEAIRSNKDILTIIGWAYDPDSINSPVSLHVYVGGRAGSGVSSYISDINGKLIKANLYRTDLERYWGFEAQIKVKDRGKQNIYIYAINNEGGNNPELTLLQGVSNTVTLTNPSTEVSEDSSTESSEETSTEPSEESSNESSEESSVESSEESSTESGEESTESSGEPSTEPREEPSDIFDMSNPSDVSDDTVYGDADGDGEVSMKDVLRIRKFIAGVIKGDFLMTDFFAADVNHDNSVDMKDVLLIRKFIAGLIDKFPRTTA